MPLTETLIGGAAGGIGANLAGESLKPILGKMGDWHRYMLLFAIVFLVFLWFIILPGNVKRRAK